MFQDVHGKPATSRRYWARSLLGWRRLRGAQPNDAHRALARLQQQHRVERLVTQNVDRLHQAAGSADTIDLHGRIDRSAVPAASKPWPREQLQAELLTLNPSWATLDAQLAPDGDADLAALDFSSFQVPARARAAAAC